jgi:hypothetical protein
MTRRHKQGSNANDVPLDEALAALIASTRARARALPLTRIAELLAVAVAQLGGYREVAERVGLSAKMLRQFSYVERLCTPVKALFARRTLDSVDAATHLAMLSNGDQLYAANALADGRINTSDLRAVVQARGARPQEPIEQVVERVRESRTKRHFVAEFIVRGPRGPQEILTELHKHICAEDIVEIDTDGVLGRLVLTQSGKHQLFRAARTMGVSSKNVISAIVSGSNT